MMPQTTTLMRWRVAVVGRGRLGSALCEALDRAGNEVAVVPGYPTPDRKAMTAGCAAVVLAVRDDAIESCARALTDEGALDGSQALLHCAGSRSAESLGAFPAAGRALCHPLTSIAPDAGPDVFRGVTFAITGDAEGRMHAERIARAVGGIPVAIERAGLPLYHAGAVMASNYLPALLAAGTRLLVAAGFPDEASARRALGPLVRATLENALRMGPAAALTGPIARGDLDTVELHLGAMAGLPDLEALYRALGEATSLLAPALEGNTRSTLLERLRRG